MQETDQIAIGLTLNIRSEVVNFVFFNELKSNLTEKNRKKLLDYSIWCDFMERLLKNKIAFSYESGYPDSILQTMLCSVNIKGK